MTPYPRQVGEVDEEGYFRGMCCGAIVPGSDYSRQQGFTCDIVCTRPQGHGGPHVAHEGFTRRILAIDPSFDPLLAVSEGL